MARQCFHRKSNPSILPASAAPPWRPPPRPCGTKALPSPARTRMFIRPCPRSSPTQKIEAMNGYAERNLAHKPDLVVIGNAISRGNPEAEFVLDHKLRYCSLPELLREFFIRGKRSIVVAGTHGKTTTTSLLTWVFEHNGLNPSYLIGGIPTTSARARGSPTPMNREQAANGSSSRATNTTRRFSTTQQVHPLPAGNRRRQQPSNSITRTFLKIWTPSKKPSRTSSGSSRATACCSATGDDPNLAAPARGDPLPGQALRPGRRQCDSRLQPPVRADGDGI